MRRLALAAISSALVLGAGTAAAGDGDACAARLRAAHGQARLPVACRTLRPLRLGEDAGAAERLFGPPDATTTATDGARTSAWVFTRGLGRLLAARPVAPDALSYGVLYVRSRDGEITGVRDETSGLLPRLSFAGVAPGEPVARADARLGAPTSVSRARDFRSYAPLPLAVYADEGGRTVTGFELGESAADLHGPEAQGRPVADAAGRVRGLELSFPEPR